ncbi:MAG: EVE domain-containing protein [Bacteroidetes bacterium]|nr:EVE domain-containing protein [Bacteroidota bacterium]
MLSKYWMATVSKEHVLHGIELGIAQACHGKKYPLQRMKKGDGIIFYSPKDKMQSSNKLQEFTGIGIIKNDKIYQVDLGAFKPFRTQVDFFKDFRTLKISLLPIERKKWFTKIRFGHFEINQIDFLYIANLMNINNEEILQKQKNYQS